MALHPTTINAENEQDFVKGAVEIMTGIIKKSIAKNGRAFIGLSGGKTPAPIYTALGQEKDIDWSKVWIFLVDDRYIRKDSPHSNQFLVRSTLLHHAPIPESQILFPNTTLKLDECVDEFERVIIAAFAKHEPDLLVLGMGKDGHIASLFPPLTENATSRRAVIRTTTDRFDVHHRITLTIPALQKAKQALFLVTGKEKREVWQEMTESRDGVNRWPMKGIIQKMPTTVITAL